MPENFDYGVDLDALVEQEMALLDRSSDYDEYTDLLVREFDDWDEEYVEFDNEVFEL